VGGVGVAGESSRVLTRASWGSGYPEDVRARFQAPAGSVSAL
jgi:hypothetical protein